jgi:hypothetical protein
MVDRLVLTSLDQPVFILKILFTFFKKGSLMRRSTALSLLLQLVFPGFSGKGKTRFIIFGPGKTEQRSFQ